MGKAISELDSYTGPMSGTTKMPVSDSDTLKTGTASQVKTYIEGAIGTAQFRALLDDATAADQRTTLGLGDAATKNTGTTTGTVAAGDDARLSDERVPTAAGMASKTHGATSKTTPADDDEFGGVDSAASWGLIRITWANIKATLKTYFDGLYLAVTGGTITDTTSAVGGASAGSALTLNQTWNTTGTPTALKVDVSDTASNSNSLLMDLKVGRESKFRVRKTGGIVVGNSNNPPEQVGFNYNTDSDGGFFLGSYGSYGVHFGSNCIVGWGGGAPGAKDLYIRRDAAGTLAQRNGTNAQTSRLYGTYTDGSNYRRVAISMTTGGVASIAPEGAGTGASGNVLHISGLPTSNPGAGILWNDGGTVKVGT